MPEAAAAQACSLFSGHGAGGEEFKQHIPAAIKSLYADAGEQGLSFGRQTFFAGHHMPLI